MAERVDVSRLSVAECMALGGGDSADGPAKAAFGKDRVKYATISFG